MTQTNKMLPEAIHQDALAFTSKKQNPKMGKRPDGSVRLALTTQEAAKALGVSVRSLARLEERKLIKPSRALRVKTWPVTELVRFLEETAA